MKLKTVEVLRIRLDEKPRDGYGQCMHIGIADKVMFRANYHSKDNDFYIEFMNCVELIRGDYSFEYLECKTEEEVLKKCKDIMIAFFLKFTKDKIEFGETEIKNYKDA